MTTVYISKARKGSQDVRRSGGFSSNTSQINKNTTQIENILKSATTEVTPTTFGIALNFKDKISFDYKCPEDMLITEIVYEIDGSSVTITNVSGEDYVLGSFLSQFEVITIKPTNIGMVILIGEFKL